MKLAIGGRQGGAERVQTGQCAIERAAILKFQCSRVWLEGAASAASARRSRRGAGCGRGQPAQMTGQHLHLGVVEIELGHAPVGAAAAHQDGKFPVGMRSDEGQQAGCPIRAIGIAAVTEGALSSERPRGSGLRLRDQRRRQQEEAEPCLSHED
jgi:hypothetical protein